MWIWKTFFADQNDMGEEGIGGLGIGFWVMGNGY